MITTTELALLVQKMRAAQREYFRSRNPNLVPGCKKLESEVDRAVEEALGAPSLFDPKGEPGE